MDIKMHYKYLTEDELDYTNESYKKYKFLFSAESEEKGYWNRSANIELLFDVNFNVEDNDEFSASVYVQINSRLLPGTSISTAFSETINGVLKTYDISKLVLNCNNLIDITAKHISNAELYGVESNKFVNDYLIKFGTWRNDL